MIFLYKILYKIFQLRYFNKNVFILNFKEQFIWKSIGVTIASCDTFIWIQSCFI